MTSAGSMVLDFDFLAWYGCDYGNLMQAKDLIERLELNLAVAHNAEMLSGGGFEVDIVS